MDNSNDDLCSKQQNPAHNNSMKGTALKCAKCNSRCFQQGNKSANCILSDLVQVKEEDLDLSWLGRKLAYLCRILLVNSHYYVAYAYNHPSPSLFPMSSSQSSSPLHFVNHIPRSVQHDPD